MCCVPGCLVPENEVERFFDRILYGTRRLLVVFAFRMMLRLLPRIPLGYVPEDEFDRHLFCFSFQRDIVL